MAALPDATIRTLLEPFVAQFGPATLTDELVGQISAYLDLLVRWNARVSLTSIRQPEEMVTRHFGESLFSGGHLVARLSDGATLLDFGSGAGFPGLPIQLVLPRIHVALAESQARKVAFLREVIRVLGLPTEVWPRRVEELPETRRFEAVTMRAVDRMALSLTEASKVLKPGGSLVALVGQSLVGQSVDASGAEEFHIPASEHRRLLIWPDVPRGTSAPNRL